MTERRPSEVSDTPPARTVSSLDLISPLLVSIRTTDSAVTARRLLSNQPPVGPIREVGADRKDCWDAGFVSPGS